MLSSIFLPLPHTNLSFVLQLFKSSQPLIAAFVALYALLMSAHLFIVPQTGVEALPMGILSQWIYQYIIPGTLLAKVVGVVLLFIQALLVNYVVNRFKMLPHRNWLPAVTYLLVMGFLQTSVGLTPVVMANTFLLIAIIELFKIYRSHKCADYIFNVGFWLAIGSLFYFSMSVFVIWGIIGLFLLRSSGLNDLLILLIGFFVPYLLLGTAYYWTDVLPQFWQYQFADNFSVTDWLVRKDLQLYLKPTITILGILFFVVLFGKVFARISTQAQKNYTLIYWTLVIGGLALMIQKDLNADHLAIVGVPLGILLATIWEKTKNTMTVELTHLVLLIGVLVYQFWSVL